MKPYLEAYTTDDDDDEWHELTPDEMAKLISGNPSNPRRAALNQSRDSSAEDISASIDLDTESKGDARYDAYLKFDKNSGSRIYASLIPEISNGETRKRKRGVRASLSHGMLVNSIIANALRATAIAPTRKVYYYRAYSVYSRDGKGLYYPAYLGAKAVCGTIDLMREGGWLTTELGSRKSYDKSAQCSTFAATDKLIDACKDLGISHEHVVKDGAPVLFLKDEDKNLVSYDRDLVQDKARPVRAYNAFLLDHNLSLDVTSDELKEINSAREANGALQLLDLQSKYLYRVFNNGDWTQGGRFYGGWWQGVPSRWRPRIKIDGEKTVELDYSGFLARALYHLEGHDFLDDPYEIPAIVAQSEASGRDWETVRPGVKKAIVAMINAKPDDKLTGITGFDFPKGLTKAKAFDLISQHHATIAHKFRCGEGLKMMSKESSICQTILSNSRAEGIVVLPIHDSYRVQAQHKQWLHDQMASTYLELFGYPPIIKEDEGRGEKVTVDRRDIEGAASECSSNGATVTNKARFETEEEVIGYASE